MKFWLDVSILRCSNCESRYADASWYVIEMESDIQCGCCGKEFNSKKNATDRALLEFQIDDSGKIHKVEIAKRIKLK